MPRPSEFTQAIADAICERIAEGESLRSICRADEFPAKSTVFKWLSQQPAFADQYARARTAQADAWADDIVEISDDSSGDTIADEEGHKRQDNEFIARSRLRVDTRKWLMARMAPKKYGDKITQEHTGADGGPIEISRIELVPGPANVDGKD